MFENLFFPDFSDIRREKVAVTDLMERCASCIVGSIYIRTFLNQFCSLYEIAMGDGKMKRGIQAVVPDIGVHLHLVQKEAQDILCFLSRCDMQQRLSLPEFGVDVSSVLQSLLQ